MSTKPTKAGKTIRNNTNHQVLSILCEPGTVPCQLPNPVTNLSCWVSSICMPKSSLYSSPSCSLLRSHDLYGLQQRAPLPRGTGKREEGGDKDGVLIFLASVCCLRQVGCAPLPRASAPARQSSPSSSSP